MAAIIAVIVTGFLLVSIAIERSTCETNDTKVFHSNQASTNSTSRESYRCLRYLYQIDQELASVIPPLDSMEDNYHSIYQALFPSNNLPALYVKVTIQFLLDYQNGTKVIDESMTKKFTWSEACTFVSVDFISLDAMSFLSLGTILPQRRQTELTLTVPPVCHNSTLQRNTNLWRDVVSTVRTPAYRNRSTIDINR
jgi:hypothetical protein